MLIKYASSIQCVRVSIFEFNRRHSSRWHNANKTRPRRLSRLMRFLYIRPLFPRRRSAFPFCVSDLGESVESHVSRPARLPIKIFSLTNVRSPAKLFAKLISARPPLRAAAAEEYGIIIVVRESLEDPP